MADAGGASTKLGGASSIRHTHFGTHFRQKTKKGIQKGMQKSMPKKYRNLMPKGYQNNTKMEAQIKRFSNFF